MTKDISERMLDRFPDISVEESRKFSELSLVHLRAKGNLVFYELLINLGENYAAEFYRNSRNGS